MKGYISTAALAFALGATITVGSGITSDIEAWRLAMAEEKKQASQIEGLFAKEELKQLKIDTQFKELELQLAKRRVALQIEGIDAEEANQKTRQRIELRSEAEWAWWMDALKIAWMVALGAVVPFVMLALILVRIAKGMFEGGRHHG